MQNYREPSRSRHEQEIPATVLSDYVVLGPAGARPGELHDELVRRVDLWRGVGSAPAAPYVALDAAAAVRDTLRELRGPSSTGSAAIVHRADGTVDRLLLTGRSPRPSWSGIRALADQSAFDQPPVGDSLRRATALLEPWSGLLALTRRTLDCYGAGLDERVALNLVLDGLRAQAVEPYPGRGPLPTGAVVAAAGPTESYWLLDGALTLLSRQAVAGSAFEAGRLGAEHGAAVYRVPDLPGDWRIARITAEPSGAVLSAAWGAGAAGAVRHATATALAARSTPHGRGSHRVGAPSTDELLGLLNQRSMDRLTADVLQCLASRRLRVLGVRVEEDPLLGGQPLAWGPVWLR